MEKISFPTQNKEQITNLLPPILLMGLIFLASSVPANDNSEKWNLMDLLNPALQNVLHIPLFGVLSIFWLKSLTQQGGATRHKILIAISIVFAYGLIDEFHQYFVPGRFCSSTDMFFNCLGAIAGIVFFLLYRHYTKNLGDVH